MFKRAKYQLYLFQLENYNTARYVALAPQFFGKLPKTLRQEIVWTNKLKALLTFAIVLQLAAAAGLGMVTAWLSGSRNFAEVILWVVVWFSILYFLLFIFLLMTHTLLLPLDHYLKKKIVRRATAKMAAMRGVKVVGIAGSYGKTTMKEMVAAVLSRDYKVLQTPENINTPLGIARLVLEKITPQIQIFIVEMGEHEPGDIRDICGMVMPDIGIITGINEAHLERMGNIKKTVSTIFELADTPGNAPILLNADDHLVRENYKTHLQGHQPVFYSSEGNPLAEYSLKSEVFHEDASGNSFQLFKGKEKVGDFTTRLLGHYALGTATAAVMAAERLGVPAGAAQVAIAKVAPVPHRLEPVPNQNGVVVIDDSYNGNPEGVKEAIRVLSNFRARRRLYITPGLVEMGARSREVHRVIGRELASVADKVILIRNSVTGWIAAGLKEAGFNEADVIFFASALEAHAGLGDIVRAGDVVLFQNDWPDNYF